MVADGRLEQGKRLGRGEPRQFGSRARSDGPPFPGPRRGRAGVPPFLLCHQRPVILLRNDLCGHPGRVPRVLGHRAGAGAPRWIRWSVAATWTMLVFERGMWHAMQSSPRPPGLPLGQWQGATLLFVAFETALAVVGSLDGRFGQPVRVVAGDAAELALARAEAAARFQLLDLPGHLELALVAVLLDENRQETVQGEAWAEVEEVTARPGEAEPALQMALLADRIPQRGG